ncbi:MAG TPA: pilus assembly protein N-terminal domain-containing protein [Polyangiaceae bacterium]|nr:pilus assembly protein N-terminal domain-containing protein [Polyangiaceae bacterium]
MNARQFGFRGVLLALALCLPNLGYAQAPKRAPAEKSEKSEKPERPPEGNEIVLAVGETRTISARDVKNYSEGVPGIIDVRLTSDANQFVLVGKKPGSTTLLLIKNDGSQNALNINVFHRSPVAVEKELAELLSGLPVRSRRIGAQIVLDGVVDDEGALQRVQKIASLYPDQVTTLVQLASKGGVPTPVAGIENFLIRVDFYFVQYDKNSSYGVGVGWPDSIGAGATATLNYDFLLGSVRQAAATVTTQPLPRLDIATRRGWAKVLKQSTVITNNGTEATFQNGGEQNFPVNTGLTVGVERIGFGTELTVLPSYNPEHQELNVRLTADVSDLTAAISGTALPGRSTSKLTTNVTLKLGQSLVLSGIRTQSLTHSVAGLPGLSEIPLLGILFGSHSQSKLETEGAIFVVPSVVQTIPSSSADLVDVALKKFKDYDGDISTLNSYDKKPGGGVDVPR